MNIHELKEAENANPAPAWQEQAGSVYITFLPGVVPDIQEVTGKAGAHDGVHEALAAAGIGTKLGLTLS